MRKPDRQGPSFEETYPKHEFSVLVRLGIALAVLWRRRAPRRRSRPAVARRQPVEQPQLFSRPRFGKPDHGVPAP